MADRETIIDTGGGIGAGGVIAGILLVAVVVVGFFLFSNLGHGGSKTVDIDVPKVTIGVTPDGQ